MQGLAARHHDHKGGRDVQIIIDVGVPRRVCRADMPRRTVLQCQLLEGVFDNAKRLDVRISQGRNRASVLNRAKRLGVRIETSEAGSVTGPRP